MGLDISVSLIVGVPLSALGAVEEEAERKQTTDGLGRPAGKSVILKTVYFRTSNNLRFLIGTNEEHALNGKPDQIEYHLDSLWEIEKGDVDTENNWFHTSDWDQVTLDTVIVGLQVDSEIDSEVDDRHAGFEGAQMSNVQATVERVQAEISQRFGYTGKVYVLALAGYSY